MAPELGLKAVYWNLADGDHRSRGGTGTDVTSATVRLMLGAVHNRASTVKTMEEIQLLQRNGHRARIIPDGLERRDGGWVFLRGRKQDGVEKAYAVGYVVGVIDANGEIHEPPMSYFRECLGWDWPPTQGKPGARLKEEAKRGLRFLLAIATADGPLTAIEREVLVFYIGKRADQVQLPLDAAALDAVMASVERMRPSPDVARQALAKQMREESNPARSCSWPEHLALLNAAAERLIEAGNSETKCLVVFGILSEISPSTNAVRGGDGSEHDPV